MPICIHAYSHVKMGQAGSNVRNSNLSRPCEGSRQNTGTSRLLVQIPNLPRHYQGGSQNTSPSWLLKKNARYPHPDLHSHPPTHQNGASRKQSSKFLSLALVSMGTANISATVICLNIMQDTRTHTHAPHADLHSRILTR